MTTKMLAAMIAALTLTAPADHAAARTRHRHSAPIYNDAGNPMLPGERTFRNYAAKPAKSMPYRPSRRIRQHSGGILVASSGARAAVAPGALSRFKCLINGLEAEGYRIEFMGGYGRRPNASAHPSGNALDVNQVARNRVVHRLPSNTTQIAMHCGLVHGAEWHYADQGHFEMPSKIGYVYPRRHYAMR